MNKKLYYIYLLSAVVYFLQGIEGLPSLSLTLYLKEHLHFDASTIMYIGSITGLAWIIKPLWGYLCDQMLSNKAWIFISLLGSILVSLYFGLSVALPLALLIGILAFANTSSAMRDVAVDGISCIEGKEMGKNSQIQSVQWISITVAGIIASLAGGYIADHLSYQKGYLMLIPFYLIAILIALKYKKEQTCAGCKFELECNGNVKNKEVCYQKREKKSIIESVLSYKDLFTNKQFLLAGLFLFCYKYSPSFGTPLFFIERDQWHWSGTFIGMLGAIISCFEIIGAVLFFKYSQRINIKKWLYVSVFLGALTSLAYLYFTQLTAVVYGILFASLGMFIHLTMMAFLAKSTIKGKEATSFALLCGINNLAGTASSITGAFLFPKVGLTWLIILSAGTSFICIPILKRLEIK